ncbi:MAG: hypothetical protein ABIS07_05220 [Dokdonella sp.]
MSVCHVPQNPDFQGGVIGRRLFHLFKEQIMREFGSLPSTIPVQKAHKTTSDFATIDVHDDTVEGVSFHPAIKRGSKSKVTVDLFRRWTNTHRVMTFNDCANVEFVIDSDVLVGNAPNNTSHLEATAEIAEIEALMRRHKRSWNVAYQASIDPMRMKIEQAPKRTLFRVRFFGGTLVVLARSFKIRRNATTLDP